MLDWNCKKGSEEFHLYFVKLQDNVSIPYSVAVKEPMI